MTALRRYVRSFTGFERDARIFLLTTLVYGVALSLWWVDFYLYLAAALTVIRRLINRARTLYRWPARPTTRRLR